MERQEMEKVAAEKAGSVNRILVKVVDADDSYFILGEINRSHGPELAFRSPDGFTLERAGKWLDDELDRWRRAGA